MKEPQKNRFQWKLLHKGLVLVLVPLAINLFFVGMLKHLLDEADGLTLRLSHAKEVSGAINTLVRYVMDAGNSSVLYKYFHMPRFKEETVMHLEELTHQITLLEELTAADQEERQAMANIKPATKDILFVIESVVRKAENRQALPIVSESSATKQITKAVGQWKTATSELSAIEDRIEQDTPVIERKQRNLVLTWVIVGIAMNMIGAIGMAVYFNTELLKRLEVLIENTFRLARNSKLLPRIKGGDELQRLDDVFHDMATALNDASEYKKELIAIVSHDLRTPLTSIQTSLSLMEVGACGELPERAQTEIQIAERSATRLINLINDLLDIEKMEAGKLVMTMQTISSRSIIERSIEAVGSFAEQHEVRFALPKFDHQFKADADRLVQVLVNLLSNAIKFSPDESLITVEVEPSAQSVEFRVIDEGPGIPAEQLDAVFERFKQIPGVESTKLKGTGLGLTICKAIVQGHNGEIGVQSTVGMGTTFWFRIPVEESDAAITLPADIPARTPS